MGRKPRVDRSPEEKWQIVQEGMKSGNVSETCRRHGIAPNLFYRWKDEAEQGAKAALGGRSAGGWPGFDLRGCPMCRFCTACGEQRRTMGICLEPTIN